MFRAAGLDLNPASGGARASSARASKDERPPLVRLAPRRGCTGAVALRGSPAHSASKTRVNALMEAGERLRVTEQRASGPKDPLPVASNVSHGSVNTISWLVTSPLPGLSEPPAR